MYHEETPLLAGFVDVLDDFGALMRIAGGEQGKIYGGDRVVGIRSIGFVGVRGVGVVRRDGLEPIRFYQRFHGRSLRYVRMGFCCGLDQN